MNLHSTLFILLFLQIYLLNKYYLYLHSTLFILLYEFEQKIIEMINQFTFYFIYIVIICVASNKSEVSKFTFYFIYIVISTICTLSKLSK